MIPPVDKDAFLAETASDELQVKRVGAAVRAELDRMRVTRAAARDATALPTGSVARVRRRLVHRPARPSVALRWPALAALAGSALLAAFLVGRTVPGAAPAGPWNDVALKVDGLGTFGGTPRAPEIDWESGRLGVEVTPNRGVTLAVVTPEATVQVIGTGFTVDRSAFATEVVVSHGTVAVTCVGADPIRLSAPGRRRCLPIDAPTLLRRVSALRREGAPLADRLESIDAGARAAPADGPLAAELLAQRADLLGPSRPGEAVAAAVRYLRIGGPRVAEMSDLAIGLAGPGCDAAPVLEAVVAADPGSRWGVALAECLAERDPARSRTLLGAVTDAGDLSERADALRIRLGEP